MRTIEILGDNRFETFTKTRSGSRAVIIRDGMILLSHETVSGWYLVPGGGVEECETPEKCCVREVEEETGLIVQPVQQFLILNEYYEEYCYISHYFICEVTGTGTMHLTDAEIQRGLEPQWIPLNEAVELFSRHQSFAATSEEKRGSYLREYTALQEYMKFRMADFGINEMLGMQRTLQEKYKDKWSPICPERGKDQLLWMIGEVGEVIDIVKKHGGETACQDMELRASLIEELADVLMYYNDVLLCYGISAEELKQSYIRKFERNMKRW